MTVSLAASFMPPLAFFNVGGTEVIVILMIVLLLFGGEKMPELARGIGKALRDFKKAASSVEEELKKAMDEPPKPATPPAPAPTGVPSDKRYDLPQPLSTRPAGTEPASTTPPAANPPMQGLSTGSNAAAEAFNDEEPVRPIGQPIPPFPLPPSTPPAPTPPPPEAPKA